MKTCCRLPLLSIAFATALLAGAALAQCGVHWQAGAYAPGPRVYGVIRCSTWWDPDGVGPRQPVLVVGGVFAIPSVGATNLATYDPQTRRWEAMPMPPNGWVAALAVMPNGALVVGGSFSTVGFLRAGAVAIWDGTSWSTLGGGVAGGAYTYPLVDAVHVMGNGDLLVGGLFATAGSTSARGLARWDGAAWHALPGFQGVVACLTPRPNGNVVVGGTFLAPGAAFQANVAEWNGTQWTTFGAGVGGPMDNVSAAAVLVNGDLVVSGFFNNAGGVFANHIARWNGSAWSAMGAGFGNTPEALLALPNGQLLAGAAALVGAGSGGIVRWDGSQWHSYAPAIGRVLDMVPLGNGDLLALGDLSLPGDAVVRCVARWDGVSWHGGDPGFDDTVRGLVALPDGALVAFGEFRLAEGQALARLALWRGGAWQPMPLPGAGYGIDAAALDGNGNLWAAGQVGMLPAPGNVARWDGSAWQAIGGPNGAVSSITAIAFDAQQQPVVGRAVYPGYGPPVQRWNGTQWVTLGAGLDGPVRALQRLRNGMLVAGGEFLNSGGIGVSRIASWDGTAWRPMGTGLDGPVRALAELPNGDLVAAGDFIRDGSGFVPLNLVARWDGVGWRPFGPGLAGLPGTSARALVVLPNGELLVGGDFQQAGGNPAPGVARWRGGIWEAVDGGIDGMVQALAQRTDGEVVAAGDFATAGGRPAAHLARLRSNCPARAQVVGTGCAGAAGRLLLSADSLPWIGATYRATCRTVASNGIGVEVWGWQLGQVALASLHPAGGPGCLLLVSPDALVPRVVTGGVIAIALAVPGDPALVGVVLHQQVVVGELDPALNITTLAASNALTLTVGVF